MGYWHSSEDFGDYARVLIDVNPSKQLPSNLLIKPNRQSFFFCRHQIQEFVRGLRLLPLGGVCGHGFLKIKEWENVQREGSTKNKIIKLPTMP